MRSTSIINLEKVGETVIWEQTKQSGCNRTSVLILIFDKTDKK